LTAITIKYITNSENAGTHPMTVDIGAICKNGKAAVVAADRMVTFGAPMNLQTESPSLRKIIELTDNALIVFSGNTADGEQIVSGTQTKADRSDHSIASPNRPSGARVVFTT
jgi:ATP-dependent protease HslVU (ClpYQ) peptidase subunit